MSTVPASMQEASIHAHCKTLRIPTIAAQYSRIAEQATRQGHSHIRYLEALHAAEVEERQQRRIAWRLSGIARHTRTIRSCVAACGFSIMFT